MVMLSELEKKNANLLMDAINIPEKCALSAAMVFKKEGYGNLISVSEDIRTEHVIRAYLKFDSGVFYGIFNIRGSLGIIRENGPEGKIVFGRVL